MCIRDSTNPVALLLIFPVRSVFEINNDNSVINAPIPTSPLLNPPQSIDAIFFKAFAKIPIDILIAIIKEHAFIVLEILPCISEILFKACTNSTNKTVNATNELVNASAFIVDSVKIAPAKIPIATAILIRVPAVSYTHLDVYKRQEQRRNNLVVTCIRSYMFLHL